MALVQNMSLNMGLGLRLRLNHSGSLDMVVVVVCFSSVKGESIISRVIVEVETPMHGLTHPVVHSLLDMR